MCRCCYDNYCKALLCIWLAAEMSMIIFVYVERKEETAELRQLLGLESVRAVVRKGLFGCVECTDDADWLKCSMVIEVDGA